MAQKWLSKRRGKERKKGRRKEKAKVTRRCSLPDGRCGLEIDYHAGREGRARIDIGGRLGSFRLGSRLGGRLGCAFEFRLFALALLLLLLGRARTAVRRAAARAGPAATARR